MCIWVCVDRGMSIGEYWRVCWLMGHEVGFGYAIGLASVQLRIQIQFIIQVNNHKMMRLYRNLHKYSLSKSCAASRSTTLQSSSPSYRPISYNFKLALHPGKTYSGLASISFNLPTSPVSSPLFLDFSGKQITNILVNSHNVDPAQTYSKDKGRIELPVQHLRNGNNEIYVRYENEYDTDGSGCVSFIDVDNKQYLYTQFQPYMANRVFPLFDQPDLKATMDLSISCLKEWETVLSNQPQSPPINTRIQNPVCKLTRQLLHSFSSSLPKTYKTTTFPATKPLPSYLFCFVVGPYKKYTPSHTYKNIPMNYYCIESLYKYMQMNMPFIEEMTNKSMQFFENYFGYAYPFSKYDQIFAHQYKWGAMENAGIVTLNDLYIFKDPVSVEKMIGFGNTIVHQMAHHWFGNLVTMKWWDDLWLNQSFAEYISHYCLQKIQPTVKSINYQSAMYSFLNRKLWGYNEDQLITTHPICSNVQNTQVAQSIFDGITYSKGAATMKQLMYLIGEKQFSLALKEYFGKYEWRNAELADLLAIVGKYYKKKGGVGMQEWRDMWLEKAGLNILSYQFDPKTQKLIIKQSAYHQNHPTLRSHTLKIAFLESPKQIISTQVTINPTQKTQIKLSPQLTSACINAKAIILNYQDLAYCKCILNDKSIEYLKDNVNQIDDILLRSMIWKNFYDMVKDAHLKTDQYIDILCKSIFEQKSDAILEQNLNYAITVIQKYLPKQYRSECKRKLLQKCVQYESKDKNKNKNREIVIKDKIIAFTDADNKQGIIRLYKWYKGSEDKLTNKLGNPNITEKWKIVIKVLSSPVLDKKTKIELLNDMISQDSSDTMKNKKLTCDALLMSQKQTQQYFDKIITDSTQAWSTSTFIHAISGVNSRIHQDSWNSCLKQRYFDAVKTALEKKQHNLNVLKKSQFIETFIDHMDPCLEDNIQDLKHKVQKLRNITVTNNDKIKIQLKKKIDMLQKRIKCYQLFK